MEIVRGFPSTMQDDYQLNLINMNCDCYVMITLAPIPTPITQ